VARGELYIHPALADALSKDEGQSRVEEAIEPLTQRELEVLRLVALGYTTAEIGNQLSLSTRTIEHHRANLRDKIGAHTRADISRYAAERGLLPSDRDPW
jgi:DNA-binding NarL/FixJ family response regulator